MSIRSRILAAISVFVMASCQGSPEAGPTVARVDSAGIEIVEATGPVRGRLEASPEPLLQIGLEVGPEELLFQRIVGVTRLDDGRLAVGDGGSHSVRIFKSSGEFDLAMGGEGGGPGEFEYLRSVQRCRPNLITAFNIDWTRSEFDLDGVFLGLDRIVLPENRQPYEISCDSDGTVAATAWPNSGGSPQGYYRTTVPLYVVDLAKPAASTLGQFPGSERVGRPSSHGPHPAGKTTYTAISDGRVFVATGDDYELKQFSPTGVLERLVRWRGPDRAGGEEALAAYVRGRLENASPDRQPSIRAFYRDFPVLDSIPATARLIMSTDATLWVESFRSPGAEEVAWWGFSQDGTWLWTLALPAEFTPMEFSAIEVLGVHEDDLGVQRVYVYALTPSGGSV